MFCVINDFFGVQYGRLKNERNFNLTKPSNDIIDRIYDIKESDRK